MMLCFFPHVIGGGPLPKDGLFVKTPSAYKDLSQFKFKKFYDNIISKVNALDVDPIGFSAMPIHLGTQKIIITGVRIKGYHDEDRAKKRILPGEFNPVLPLESFMDAIAKMKSLESTPISHSESSRAIVKPLIHDLRKFNAQIKSQAEEIYTGSDFADGTKNLRERAQNIYATSSLMSVRLNAHDLMENPELITITKRTSINPYKKFEKAAKCLESQARKKSINICITGNNYDAFLGDPIFDNIPFVLLENAIKYSPDHQEIEISFKNKTPDILEVSVRNMGPSIDQAELGKIFENGFRGSSAREIITDGTGLGLHFVKLVCDAHNIQINATSDKRGNVVINDIPYWTFQITLTIKLH